jgi:hypothetical protein
MAYSYDFNSRKDAKQLSLGMKAKNEPEWSLLKGDLEEIGLNKRRMRSNFAEKFTKEGAKETRFRSGIL